MQTKQKKRTENEARLTEAIKILQGIADSYETPGDARKVARDSVAALRDARRSMGERTAYAISILEELAESSRIPSCTRVGLWTAISKLEPVRE